MDKGFQYADQLEAHLDSGGKFNAGNVRDLIGFIKAYHARGIELVQVVMVCLDAMNPPDRGGISMHEWNKRLKAAMQQAYSALSDTYQQPEHGWTCFHCGETFTAPGAARDHFGETPGKVAGCMIKAGDERGLLMEFRKLERERDELKVRLGAFRCGADEEDSVNRFRACRN